MNRRRSIATSVLSCFIIQLFLLSHNVRAVRRVPSDMDSELHQTNVQKQRHAALRKLQGRTKKRRLEEITPPKLSPTDHLVTDLPLLLVNDEYETETTLLFAGHLPASPDHERQLFYWLVGPPLEVRDDPTIPLLIWLNGGPGCSSSEGFFLENGPYNFRLIQDEWKLVPNPYSWHLSPAWVLYVDQPVGTGLSFTTDGHYCSTDEEVNRDFIYFLEEFLLLHGQVFLKENTDQTNGPPQMIRPLYFSGESHAGHYIPSMMDYILERQAQQQPQRVDLRVHGAAIGNGWMDPYYQYSVSTIAYGAGLINLSQKVHLDKLEVECQTELEKNNLHSSVCFSLLDHVRDQSHGDTAQTRVSQYNYQVTVNKGGASQYPPGGKLIDCYLGGQAEPPVGQWNANLEEVLDAIHATKSLEADQHYLGCTNRPYQALKYQDGLGVVPQLKNILDHPDQIRLLFYNGMNDLICNHVGNELLLQKLPWTKSEQWTMAPRYAWHLQQVDTAHEESTTSIVAAYVQEFDNLMYLKIPNSGHMVPMDQPEISLQMIRTFLHKESFQSSQQELQSDLPSRTSCDEEAE